MTKIVERLKRQYVARHLLEPPAPEVVGQLIEELSALEQERDRLVGALDECLRIVDEHDGYSNRIQMVIDAALAGSGKEPNV